MPSTMTPNMGLTIPAVGQQPGPQYATDIDTSLTVIDQHDHTPGNGVQITPSALNINSDLPFLSNNAINLRSLRFTPQGSALAGPSDLGCLYEVGVDLFYNDGSGNKIRITQGGSIAGVSGSITGLTSPASAVYNMGTKTFIWQSDVNKAANLDAGSVIIRKLTALSAGITIAPPSALASNYTFTLPVAPPSVNSLLVMDNSGNVTTTANPVSLELTGNLIVDGEVVGNLAVNGDINTANITCITLTATGAVTSDTSIFPSGTSFAELISFSANQIEVKNPISSASFQIPVGAGGNTGMIVSGAVNSTGTAVLGTGFTMGTIGTGHYEVNYTAGQFDGIGTPTVIASPSFTAGSFTIAHAVVTVLSPTSFTVLMHDGGGTSVDCGFTFVAFGNVGY